MPLDGERLVVEPSYPYAAVFDKEPEPSKYDGWRLRNIWYSHQKRCEVGIMQDPDGKLHAGMMPAFHHIGHDLRTMGCSEAWGVEQEGRAVQLLGTMLRHHQFKKYLLTGMFIETSARSGVIYIFRKLKPTVALAPVRDPEGEPKILCCLCMHPIAYYADSWAGAMCPTDDVIAHLSMMRGDEHLFWKRCNQHPAYRPEAGL